MMAALTEKQAELFRGKNWGNVVTLRSDGSPHVTPVWLDYDGEHVVFNTVVGRAKGRHIRRDPRVAISVLPAADQQSGYVSVTGRAEIVEEGANEHIDKLAKKYLGEDTYPWHQPDDRRVIVKVTTDKVDAMGID
jgi:PPOX class probable F420-dependent enzyme